MKQLIAPEEMLRCEKAYFESSGVPSIDVMERAAACLQDAVLQDFPHAKTVYFACGPGGNGGDGYACARMLHDAGLQVRIFEVCEAKSSDAVLNRSRALEIGIPFGGDSCPEPDLWVDCLYGTGLSRAPEGRAAALIERMNASPAKILAADIPSGLNGRTGLAYTPCVQADMTVTFQYAKCGHILQDGLDVCGRLMIADVGFPEEAFPVKMPQWLMPDDLRVLFPPRKRNLHKGKCGHLLIVAGSVGMAGAAVLCTRAALRSGVGLVSVACPAEIVPIIQSSAPCAMCFPLPQEGGHIAPEAIDTLRTALIGKSAVAVGCGLTRAVSAEIIRIILEAGLPAVIDADALNILSAYPDLKQSLRPYHIITPHPGEAARLLGRSCSDSIQDARELAAMGCCAVLKGASRAICGSEHCYVSASGSCAMARGGSGDILTGILGAVLAEPSSRTTAENTAAACEIHGLCGELAAEKYGVRAANAADLIEMLPEVLKKYVD